MSNVTPLKRARQEIADLRLQIRRFQGTSPAKRELLNTISFMSDTENVERFCDALNRLIHSLAKNPLSGKGE